MGTTMWGNRRCRCRWSRAEVSRCYVFMLMCRRPHHTHTPSFVILLFISGYRRRWKAPPSQGDGVIIRGGRLPPRRAAPRHRSHRPRCCDANAIDAAPVMPTPSMQRRRCNANDALSTTPLPSSALPRYQITSVFVGVSVAIA